jgi:hypothetical protein
MCICCVALASRARHLPVDQHVDNGRLRRNVLTESICLNLSSTHITAHNHSMILLNIIKSGAHMPHNKTTTKKNKEKTNKKIAALLLDNFLAQQIVKNAGHILFTLELKVFEMRYQRQRQILCNSLVAQLVGY